MEKKIIKVAYNKHTLVADICPVGSIPKVFCMHGAGSSYRQIYDSLRAILLENNISSCALDFLGHGESDGNIKDSSLKSRTEQVIAIIKEARAVEPLILIGSSMGGYNAIKLTEIYEVKLMILIAPGVFDKNAYEIPFGDDFSSAIRRHRSWDDTDAWNILNKYKGKILIVKGDKDDVIPAEIFQKIYDNSLNTGYREMITISNAPHKLMTFYFPEYPEDFKMVAGKIISLLK